MTLLFKVEYLNNAWGHVSRGMSILDNGKVYEFNSRGAGEKPVLVGKLLSDQMRDLKGLLSCAKDGVLSEIKTLRYDGGNVTYSGYWKGKEVELKISGDNNSSIEWPCAKGLVSMLGKIMAFYKIKV